MKSAATPKEIIKMIYIKIKLPQEDIMAK